ncbi:MAG: rod-binding protein [Lachnospiraceae bacterium]|nr:rod-binding protein [Lachnospiraceae bacterium]
MSLNIGSDMAQAYGLANSQTDAYASVKANELKATLANVENATDEELMQVCKDFESYLVEQVFKSMKKTVPKNDDEENEYMQYFGDNLYQEYASNISDKGDLGIAQTLYESMKRNYGVGSSISTEKKSES